MSVLIHMDNYVLVATLLIGWAERGPNTRSMAWLVECQGQSHVLRFPFLSCGEIFSVLICLTPDTDVLSDDK